MKPHEVPTRMPHVDEREPQVAPAGYRSRVLAFVESVCIQRVIIALVVLNAITLGLETSPGVMGAIGPGIRALDAAFLTAFVVELSLKLLGHGSRFFRSGWNLFDLVVVGVALLPTSGGFSVLRALRVLRVLRLMSTLPKMRFVVESLGRSIPGLGSIGFLLAIFFYVFAVMGTKLFGADFPQWFGSLWASMFSLFQIMTLEGWVEIARDVMTRYPIAWMYFLAFILLATFTVLNLFIAVIVNSMQDASTPVPHERIASARDIEALREAIEALRRAITRDGGAR